MKVITIKQIINSLGIEQEALLRELPDAIKSFKDGKLRLLVGEGKDAKIVVVNDVDIEFIKKNAEKGPTFLADHFELSLNTLLDALEQLKSCKAITQETYESIVEVKDKPAIKTWFEPDEIMAGEKASLCVEVYPPTTIDNPKILLSLPPHLELIHEPKLPIKLLTGKFAQKYILKAERHGKHKLGFTLEGSIEGKRLSDVVGEASLKVKPQPPEIEVELTTAQEASAIFNREFNIGLKIRNGGRGDCMNMRVTGMDNYKDFDVIGGGVIGNLAPGGVLSHVLRLRPRKSGKYMLDKLSLSFQDAEGTIDTKTIPPITVEVRTLQPELKIELLYPATRIRAKQVFTLVGRISNIGKGKARNIPVNLPVPFELLVSGQPEFFIPELDAGTSEEFELSLRAPEESELKIGKFEIEFQDEESKKLTGEYPGILIPISLEEREPTIAEKPWCFIPGAVIGDRKYRIIKEIGEGGFAKVYLAEHLFLKRNVALKALKPAFIRDPAKVDRFMSEVKVAIDLRDPSIVVVHDIDVEEYEGERYPFIVMEYLPGGTLQDRLRAGQPSPYNDVHSVLRDMCEALITAHESKIIHCDIKPSNIFYDEKKDLWKLGDFGLSSIMRGKEAESTGGTLSYMAPEVREGKKITEKSDIYSLGVLLREMLTGRPSGDLSRVRATYKGLDESLLEELISLVEKMTAHEPAKRSSLMEISRFVRKSRSITAESG